MIGRNRPVAAGQSCPPNFCKAVVCITINWLLAENKKMDRGCPEYVQMGLLLIWFCNRGRGSIQAAICRNRHGSFLYEI